MTEDELKAFSQEAHCTKCRGTGTRTSEAFEFEGRHYPAQTRRCGFCQGRGAFPGVDTGAILALIVAPRTKRFRRSWPSKLVVWRTGDSTVRRAYYVWRLARFHGGADVTMPMTAVRVTEGDPHTRLLDLMADAVAQHVFGTDRAAMYRWGSLLGFVKGEPPKGLPSSAYECGPVVTHGPKPEFEQLELR